MAQLTKSQPLVVLTEFRAAASALHSTVRDTHDYRMIKNAEWDYLGALTRAEIEFRNRMPELGEKQRETIEHILASGRDAGQMVKTVLKDVENYSLLRFGGRARKDMYRELVAEKLNDIHEEIDKALWQGLLREQTVFDSYGRKMSMLFAT